MERPLAILLICIGIVMWGSNIFAESCCKSCGKASVGNLEEQKKQNRSVSDTQGEKDARESQAAETSRTGEFCSFKDMELQQLLRELNDPSLTAKKIPGGESEVRRKYRIARKLRNFDCCCAKEALEKLIKENACEGLGEGMIFCVKWVANSSLQEVKSKKDLKKLTPDASLEDQLKIIKKYGSLPHENDFASHVVKKFLLEQSENNPSVYVPLLIEYFPHHHGLQKIADQYPEEVDTGLKRSIFSTDPTAVWTGINLARTFARVQLMDLVYKVAFEEIGPLDYSQRDDIEAIQNTAIGFFRTFEKQAVPHYRGILFSKYESEKEYVVSILKDLKSPEFLALLQEFSAYLANRQDQVNTLLAVRVQKKIAEMEAVQQ